jgi:hypothetical protein
MADIIDLHKVLKNKNGETLRCLTCNECGGQTWVNFYDKNNWIAAMACASKHKDGRKCECVIDLDEIVWADEEE